MPAMPQSCKVMISENHLRRQKLFNSNMFESHLGGLAQATRQIVSGQNSKLGSLENSFVFNPSTVAVSRQPSTTMNSKSCHRQTNTSLNKLQAFPTENSKTIMIDDCHARMPNPSPSVSGTATTNLAIPNANIFGATNFNSSLETSKPVSPMNGDQASVLAEVLQKVMQMEQQISMLKNENQKLREKLDLRPACHHCPRHEVPQTQPEPRPGSFSTAAYFPS